MTAGERGDSVSQSLSLLDIIINSGPSLTEHKVRPLAQQLARTLSLLHAHGVVHRNLKIENIFVSVDPTARNARRRAQGRAIITDFTCAAAAATSATVPEISGTVPAHAAASDSDSDLVPVTLYMPKAPLLLLVARCGDQYSPAPELLPGTYTAEPGAQVPSVPYASPPVDVWSLGVVLYTLICHRVPFDGPTIDVIRDLSLCSPASLRFPWRVSNSCRDLLRRMLHADPVARATLDEVLNHPWMNASSFRCFSILSAAAGADVPRHAALKWPDQVDRKRFNKFAARESRNGDDAWRCLFDTLKLVSRLCEPCSGGDSQVQVLGLVSHMSRLSRGVVRELPDRTVSLLAKIRSRAVLDW